MRFRLIFAAEDEGGLTPIKNDKVKSGEIPTFKACSNQRRQANIDIKPDGCKYKLVHGAPIEDYICSDMKYNSATEYSVWQRIYRACEPFSVNSIFL